MFFYQPDLVPDYNYPSSIDWGNWWSWDQAAAYDPGRSYDYVHVGAHPSHSLLILTTQTDALICAANAYWAMYRVARNYPDLVKTHTWQWYLNQAVLTVATMTDGQVGYADDGLMEETVITYLLSDLQREGLSENATLVESRMKARETIWAGERFP